MLSARRIFTRSADTPETCAGHGRQSNNEIEGMEFEILSHAGLRVEHQGTTLIVDPWLIGSAYWRSWWNYPPVDLERLKALRADFVYLSHNHWDHFHGPSLRMLGKDVPILIPEDRYSRMRDDLYAMGFKRV